MNAVTVDPGDTGAGMTGVGNRPADGLAALAVAAVGFDDGGTVTAVTAAARALLGLRPGQGVGEPLERLVGEALAGLARGPALSTCTLRVRRRGRAVTVTATVLPLDPARSDGGGVVLLTPRSRWDGAGRWVLGALVVAGVVAGWAAAGWPPARSGGMAGGGEAPAAAAQTAEPSPAAPAAVPLSVIGVIEPGRTVNVIAPFAGVVRERRFDYGAPVAAGAVLAVMDRLELDMRLREAESALLKATQRVDELNGWDTGPEVSRARRQAAAAEQDAVQARRRLADAKPLLDQGIIPRQEYEDLRRQAEVQAAALAAAREDLAAVIARGGADARRVAALEHANAAARLDELKGQLARATVTAPVAGLVLKPPPGGGGGVAAGASAPTAIEAGASLAANQIMAVIADTTTVSIAARVDEMDVGALRIGQPAEVGGDAFAVGPVTGTVAWIARQASSENGAGGVASFPIRIDLPPLTDTQSARLRLGMTATVTIKPD